MKSFYLIFAAALFFDLIVSPSFGASSWLPRLSLVLLPFVFVFAKRPILEIFFIIMGLVIWLTTGINLGIVVFSLGIALFFEKWVILKIFHREAWQTLAISSLGVLVFGVLIASISNLSSPEEIFFRGSFILSIILTTLISIPISCLLRQIIYKDVYEKTKI